MKNQIQKTTLLGIFMLLAVSFFSNRAAANEFNLYQVNYTQTFGPGLNKQIQPSLLFQPKINLNLNTNLAWAGRKDKPYKRKSPLLASALNFVLPGAGYLYNGQQHPLLSIGMMAGAVGLTYVELNLQKQESEFYPFMFGSVFVLNTSIAIDTFIKTKEKNEAHNF